MKRKLENEETSHQSKHIKEEYYFPTRIPKFILFKIFMK